MKIIVPPSQKQNYCSENDVLRFSCLEQFENTSVFWYNGSLLYVEKGSDQLHALNTKAVVGVK